MKKNNKDSLGDRMKRYESVSKTMLMHRNPTIIRIDGKAFHTFTRGFVRPFDDVLIKSMQETTKYLCENIQNCVLGYTQSDEITLVLVDYEHLDTAAWYDYEVQKLCSISASMATMAFNKAFECNMEDYIQEVKLLAIDDTSSLSEEVDAKLKQYEIYKNAYMNGAVFDARCFSVPRDEVTNCVLWRQQDATRNSIQMVGQSYFKHQELEHKNCYMIQDMLHETYGINWNDFETYKKRGSAVIRDEDGHWNIDKNMPILTGDGREYIERLINFENE